MRKTLCFVLATACLTTAIFAQDGKPKPKPKPKKKKIYSNSYIGKAPPELVTAKGAAWMNSKKPLSLASLKGRVVWIEFSFIH